MSKGLGSQARHLSQGPKDRESSGVQANQDMPAHRLLLVDDETEVPADGHFLRVPLSSVQVTRQGEPWSLLVDLLVLLPCTTCQPRSPVASELYTAYTIVCLLYNFFSGHVGFVRFCCHIFSESILQQTPSFRGSFSRFLPQSFFL